MKKLLLLFAVVTLCSSCLTVNRIKKNCDQFSAICVTGTETVIEYRDTTIFRTDTIKIQLPADTVKITDTVKIYENGLAYLPPIEKHFGVVGVRTWVNHSVLNAWGFLLDSTLLHPVTDTIFLDNVFSTQTTTKYIELPPEKYKTKFTKFCIWWFCLSVTAAAIWIGRKWLAFKLSTLLNLFL